MNDRDAALKLDAAIGQIRDGRLAEASNTLASLLMQRPDIAAARVRLARIAEAMGDRGAALENFAIAVGLLPKEVELRLEFGRLLCKTGQFGVAVGHLSAASRLSPSRADILLELGRALHREARLSDAIAVLRRACELTRDDPSAVSALAAVLYQAGQKQQAQALFDAALLRHPQRADLHLAAAQALSDAGETEAAAAAYRRSANALPDVADLQLALAQVLEDLGDRGGAERAYRHALSLEPQRGYTLGSLLQLLGGKAEPALIERAWAALYSPRATPVAKALIGYGLGKAHQAGGENDRAFEAWSLANHARRAETGPFDRDAFRQRINLLMNCFDRDFFVKRNGWGLDDPRPTFIVGMPRSGTTLIEQVLASHPQGYGFGELPDIPQIAIDLARVHGVNWPLAALTLDAQLIRDAAKAQLQRLAQTADAQASRYVDKAPLNFLHLGLIALLYPCAKIIWCRRDPRDVCVSIYSENFALQQRHATDLGDLGFYYRQHERLMEYWLSVLPNTIYEVSYEEFVAEPERCARALIDFIDIPWDDDCLRFHQQSRSIQTPSRWQVRQPIYGTSVGRWRRYERHLQPLFDALAE